MISSGPSNWSLSEHEKFSYLQADSNDNDEQAEKALCEFKYYV